LALRALSFDALLALRCKLSPRSTDDVAVAYIDTEAARDSEFYAALLTQLQSAGA
jgi:hypothetical protein